MWLRIKNELGLYSENEVFKEKYKLAVTPMAIAAYMLHPKYKGKMTECNL